MRINDDWQLGADPLQWICNAAGLERVLASMAFMSQHQGNPGALHEGKGSAVRRR